MEGFLIRDKFDFKHFTMRAVLRSHCRKTQERDDSAKVGRGGIANECLDSEYILNFELTELNIAGQ